MLTEEVPEVARECKPQYKTTFHVCPRVTFADVSLTKTTWPNPDSRDGEIDFALYKKVEHHLERGYCAEME